MYSAMAFVLMALAASWSVAFAGTNGDVTLTGRAYLPAQATAKQRADMAVIFHDTPRKEGNVQHIYCLPDGTFSIHNLEEGKYLLEVSVIGWEFPQYMLEVSQRFHDRARVIPLGSRIPLEPEVILVPMGETQTGAKKKPFNIMSLLMSPYGLMFVLAILAFFVAPNMKIDPAEMEQIQAEMKDSPFAFLMGGQAPAAGQTAQQGMTAGGAAASVAAGAAKKPAGTKKKR